jgi:hypothetical protein
VEEKQGVTSGFAPDIVADIVAGKQPIGLTTEWLRAHELPVSTL